MLRGAGGVNTFFGGAGDDVLESLGGVNVMSGGDGNDKMIAAAVVATTQFGDAGDDTMIAVSAGNGQWGGDGNDTLVGIGNTNIQSGGNGADTLIASGATNVQMGDGGADALFALGSLNVQLGGAGRDVAVGLGSTNIQHGGAGDDVLAALGGANIQIGAEGNDWLIGAGSGNLQFGGHLWSTLPTDVDLGGFDLAAAQDKLDDFTGVSGSDGDNVLLAGGTVNIQIGGRGNDDLGRGFWRGRGGALGEGRRVAAKLALVARHPRHPRDIAGEASAHVDTALAIDELAAGERGRRKLGRPDAARQRLAPAGRRRQHNRHQRGECRIPSPHDVPPHNIWGILPESALGVKSLALFSAEHAVARIP